MVQEDAAAVGQSADAGTDDNSGADAETLVAVAGLHRRSQLVDQGFEREPEAGGDRADRQVDADLPPTHLVHSGAGKNAASGISGCSSPASAALTTKVKF